MYYDPYGYDPYRSGDNFRDFCESCWRYEHKDDIAEYGYYTVREAYKNGRTPYQQYCHDY